jgi:hypothetical protein
MAGVCELVDWMTYSPPTPNEIDLKVWRTLQMRTNMARRSLLRQHPQLDGVVPPTGQDEADLLAWLIETERLHGEELPIEQATVDIQQFMTDVTKAFAPVAEWFQATMKQLNTVFREVGQSLLALGAQLEAAEREEAAVLAEHPDLVELDVSLDGYYGG